MPASYIIRVNFVDQNNQPTVLYIPDPSQSLQSRHLTTFLHAWRFVSVEVVEPSPETMAYGIRNQFFSSTDRAQLDRQAREIESMLREHVSSSPSRPNLRS